MDELLQRLKDNNCDVDSAVKRMGSSDLYKMMALKFQNDKSIDEYFKAFAVNDYETAYRNIHSMKGVVANFGFTDLYDVICSITAAMREKRYNEAERFKDELVSQHKKIIQIINS